MNGCKASQDGQHDTGEIKEWSDENTNFEIRYCANCNWIIFIDQNDIE